MKKCTSIRFCKGDKRVILVGFLICENSDSSELKYSAHLYATKSLINALLRNLIQSLLPQSTFFHLKYEKRLKNEQLFKEKNDSFITEIFYFTNDIFSEIKPTKKVSVYSYFIDLLVLRTKKGNLLGCDSKNTNDEKNLCFRAIAH